MTQPKPEVTGTAHTLPFDKLSPRDFERLCLWLVEREGYERAEHLGAAGSEQGRDIVAWREGAQWAFQCKRVKRFGPQHALAEIKKVLALPEGQRPMGLVFIVTCDVSSNARQRVRERCAGEMECHFWTGTELDEKVKRHSGIVEEFFQAAGRVYISVEHAPALPDPERVQAHRAALTHKAEYRRWADESADEHYIREESKVLPLLASPYDDETGQQREDLLKTIRDHDRLLVLGEPGMGKTVAMHRTMWETAQAADPVVVPVFVPLIFFRGDLIDSVRVALNETDRLRFDDIKTVQAFLREARCLIMLDGLNEVPGERREQAVSSIAGFLRDFPRHRYVVTSRSQDELWRRLRTGGVIEDAVVIQRITDKQVRDYLIAHLGNHRGRGLHDRLNDYLRGLSRTPLLLWMIKQAGLADEELPGNLGQLFDRFVDRMLVRDVRLETVVPSSVKKQALAHLALTLQRAHQLVCERDRATGIIAEATYKYPANTIIDESLLHGLLQGKQMVRFFHQSVQEYFVGLALCKVAEAEKGASTWHRWIQRLRHRNLAAWAQDSWWAGSFVQMSGLTEDPSWLARQLVPDRPWLAYWCSIEGKPLDEETRTIIETKTIALLYSKDVQQRLRAVRELGRFENPRTIDYLAPVLEDEADNVVDVAMEVLVNLGEPAIEALLKALDSRRERTRRAVTRALGHIWQLDELTVLGTEEASEKGRLIDDNTRVIEVYVSILDMDIPGLKANTQLVPSVTISGEETADANALADVVADLIEKTRKRELVEERAIKPLIAALKAHEAGLRAAVAAKALGQMEDPRVTDPLIAALKDSDARIRSAAAEALGLLGDPRAVPALRKVATDSDERVQSAATAALEKIGDPKRK